MDTKNSPQPPRDSVNQPSHYTQGGVECIDAIDAACEGLTGKEGFLVGQVIKYVWRWKHKNGLEDLAKANWYLGRLTKHVEGKVYEKLRRNGVPREAARRSSKVKP